MSNTDTHIIECGIPEADQYMRDVLSGEVSSCKWLKLAVKRFQNDLKRVEEDDFNYYFNPDAYYHFEKFCRDYLVHYSGQWAGDPIEWEPFQKFILGQLFGWLKEKRVNDTAVRRFRELSFSVSKKNGKSLMQACITLYHLIYESAGSETLAVATSMSHAQKLAFSTAMKMIEYDETLNTLFKTNRSPASPSITCKETDSIFRPVPTDSKKLDGTINSLLIVDESKDLTKPEVIDTLWSGTATIINPLLINCSTAGYDTESIGYNYYQRDKKLLEGNIEDETVLSILYTIDEDEDDDKKDDSEKWDEKQVWEKANPLFGTTILEDYYESRVKKAQNSSRLKTEIMVKNLNTWGKSDESWLDVGKWDENEEDLTPEELSHLPCVMSLDLSSTLDLTNIKITFFDGSDIETNTIYPFDRFYLPADRFKPNDKRMSDAYRAKMIEWERRGDITKCGNSSIDYNVVKNDIKELCRKFNPEAIVFDPYQSAILLHQLVEEGIDEDLFVEVNQSSYKNFNIPTKKTESMVLDNRIIHNGNKVMRWCVEGTKLKSNAYEAVRPSKKNSKTKIDGVITLVMTVLYLNIMSEKDQTSDGGGHPMLERMKNKRKG